MAFMITWELRLFDQDGGRVATFAAWPDLVVKLRRNKPATYALRLSGDDVRAPLFELDGILEGWWHDTDNGIAWRREFTAWTVDKHRWTDSKGARHFVSSGFGLVDLLRRDIIDAAAGSAETRKSGLGETVIKDFVDEQSGPGAGARARPGLIIEADHSPALGTTWKGQRTNKYVLEVIQEIAEATGIQFGIERTDTYEFEFRCWEPTDVRGTVIFSEERQNMGQPDVQERTSQSVTNVKVSGEGQGDLRETLYLVDAAAAALSPQNRREAAVDARDQETDDEYEARGQKALDANKATQQFAFAVKQSVNALYGEHYELGDLVTARYDGVDYDRRIEGIDWHVVANQAPLPNVSTVEVVEDGS